jgi:uncharacterized membrane protein (DUF4010 family)
VIPPTTWPYLPTLERLSLAVAVGMFVGIERERRGNGVGLRSLGFVGLLGALGGLMGEPYSVLILCFVGALSVLLNLHLLKVGQGPELTTAAAMLVTAIAGMLSGQGHTLTPVALAVATAGLLAWRQPL